MRSEHPFKQWRDKKGLSQAQMARLIGSSQSRVSRFETGEIPRLEPEQADLAFQVSHGFIKRDHCLFDTPFTRGNRGAHGSASKGGAQ